MKMSNAKAATRNEAFDLMLDLKQGGILTSEQIDSLLRYFAPARPKVAKIAEQWVATAVNRKYLMDATNGAETGEVYDGGTRMLGANAFGEWVISGLRG
jgi:hypothetical protein